MRGIVQAHDGAILMSSKVGEGTASSVLLPLTPCENESASTSGSSGQYGRSRYVLVVDDEVAVCSAISQALQRSNYRVIEAGDGEEALEELRLNEAGIDCVLLDLSMLKSSGDEVLYELRLMTAHLPVSLHSGFAEKQVGDRFRVNELTEVLQKPVQSEVLLQTESGRSVGAFAPSLRVELIQLQSDRSC